ncbi:MAG TPA: PLP-dependent aminotransferase family protein [candidate division Zixibacteria bacterium]|nr:PLP-dependent aminotransferase family protein [candidate division Zixibacteria bacterium]
MNKVCTDKWPLVDHVVSMETSVIREILKFSSQPGVISFAGGLPAPELFPLEDLKQAMIDTIDKYGASSVQYSLSMGHPLLRELIAKRETIRGVQSAQENIIITSGGQQAIELLARAFVGPGDYIITENPTYVGALQAFSYYQAKYAPVKMDSEGMLMDELEEKIKKYHPKLIYTISNFQNPTGITMSLKRRHQLVDIATKYNIPVFDDNPYGDIRFTGQPQPPLKSIGGDAVIAIGTFSKTIAPGFRIGWMNGPKDIIPVFEKVKQCTDLHTSTFSQLVLFEYINAGKAEPHVEKIKADYLTKRDIMISAMREHFPEGCTWTEPEGGLFLWVTVPKHVSTKELLPKAIEQKVAFVYGQPFFPDGSGKNTMRLNYSNATHEGIVEGIKRLAKLFKDNI